MTQHNPLAARLVGAIETDAKIIYVFSALWEPTRAVVVRIKPKPLVWMPMDFSAEKFCTENGIPFVRDLQ